MKCPSCGYTNSKDSVFCQDCGLQFKDSEVGTAGGTKKKQKIEEVLFVPKRRSSGVPTILGLGIIVIVIIVVVVGAASYTSPTSEPTSGNSSTNSNYNAATNTAPVPSVYNLSIEEASTEWISNELYFMGILKNSVNQPAKNVSVRLDLYKDKAMSQLFDTRFVTIAGAPPQGAFSFQVPVHAYPTGQFWLSYQVMSTE